jgi:hypothetical protein
MNANATCGCGFLESSEIDRMLDGGLPPERTEEFRRHIDSGCMACSLLAADMETFRDVLEGGNTDGEAGEFEYRAEMLGRILARRARKGRGVSIHRMLSVAAAFFLAAICLVALLRDSGLPGSTVTLPGGGTYDVEAMPFQRPPALRGEPAGTDLWKLAGEAYEDEEFGEAADHLSRIDPEDAGKADAELYRGISLHMTGEYRAALEALGNARRLAESDDLPVGAVTWFQGLVHLAMEDEPAAREALATSVEAGGVYSGRAAGLLERLGP